MNKKIILILVFLPAVLLSETKLSLNRCRKMALNNNDEIRAKEEAVQAAKDKQKAAYKNFFPSLDLKGSYMRLNKKITYELPGMKFPVSSFNLQKQQYEISYVRDRRGNKVLNPKTEQPIPEKVIEVPSRELEFGEKNAYLFDFTLSQPIYTGGKIRAGYKIKGYQQNITELNQDLTEKEVLYKVSSMYWKIKSLQEQVKLAQEYKKMVKSHLKDLKNYQQEGLVTQNDVLKAKVKQSDAEVQILKAQNGLQLASKTLCQLIGLPLNTQLVLTDSLQIQDTINNSRDYKELARKYRREIQILQQKKKITQSQMNLVKAKYLPDLLLKAGYYGVNPNPYNSFEEEFGRDWRVSLNLSLPIFSWNKRGNQLTASRHSHRQVKYKLKDIKEKISLEVEQAIDKVEQSRKIMSQRKIGLKQARENLRIAKENFQEGTLKSSEMLEAQTMWRKAYTKWIESKKSYKIARAKLTKTIGENFLENRK